MTDDPGRLPTFLIIGAQKSGTTSLVHYLGGHPDVFALPDEVHFFDWNFDRGVDWYRRCFSGAGGRRAVGESSPEYLYWSAGPPRIARVLPDARLIAILRNPVDRAYSHYWHNRTRGHEPLGFAEALEREVERTAGADEMTRVHYGYLDRGRYLRQLQRVCEHFPRSALQVVLFEDLRRDRVAVVQSLFRFLGVDDTVVPPSIDRVKNRFVTFRSQRLRRPIRRLPGPLRKVAARLNIRYVTYPPMDPALRARLLGEFDEEIDALGRWLGRDLRLWKDGSSPAPDRGRDRSPASPSIER